jgi:anti-anti-sigma factor
MKRHLTLATSNGHIHQRLSRSRPRPAHKQAWRHTLILTGQLDGRSAPELEEEIECLCQEGVTHITLDLRQLDAVDTRGAHVIAFRSALCKRRGHGFAVIPGSGSVQRALLEAGITDAITHVHREPPANRFDELARIDVGTNVATTMVRDL